MVTLRHCFPAIPYTVKVATGDEKDMGTESSVWIRIIGSKHKQTGKLPLDLAQRKKFEPGSIETFSVEAVDVKDIKKVEVRTHNVFDFFTMFYSLGVFFTIITCARFLLF